MYAARAGSSPGFPRTSTRPDGGAFTSVDNNYSRKEAVFVTKEQKFLNALKDIFVGAKVEGESGFINLMRIKSCYFEKGVFPRLMEDINKALEPFPDFREELFDRLYTFFHRYFSETGSIYYRHTPLHERVYEQVYTDDRDVMLFWKTHMLYYVKTDRLFKSMEIEVDGFRFFFDVSSLEHKKNNEKRELVYSFKEIRSDGAIIFDVSYSEKGRKTKLDDIRKEIKNALGLPRYTDQVPGEEVLKHAFRTFERQSEVDYFICKDARKFLKEQFDLWLYQYVFEPEYREESSRGSTIWSEKRIRQLQVLKEIAYKIIDFIAQFEDELVKIWNKPKFVLDSHYVITLDRIAKCEKGMQLLERLVAHPGMEQQLQEWRDLGIVDPDFTSENLFVTDSTGRRLHERYQYLPLDTKYFQNLELDILALVDHLDRQLDGWLIKSENYQALSTILPKFQGKIKCIYIDPPYNTGQSEIDYINKFKDSAWLSMLENRLAISKNFLTADGLLCMTIDHVELHNARCLIGMIFGEENILGLVSIKNNPSGRSTVKGFSIATEYAIFVGASDKSVIGMLPRTEEQTAQYNLQDEKGRFQWRNFLRSGGANDFRTARPRLHYPLFIKGNSIRIPKMEWDNATSSWILKEVPTPEERLVYPIVNGVEYTWRLGIESLRDHLADIRVRYSRKGEPIIEIKFRPDSEGILPKTFWDDKLYNATAYGTSLLRDIMGKPQTFSFPKSVYAVADSIRVCAPNEDAYILDFFAGSGTTAHAVIDLNRQDGGQRKYILVEMADYFDTVLLPRIKKVVFSDKWKDGKAEENGKGISHFVKYFRLEQYEDVLRRACYKDAEPVFIQTDPYSQYVFLRDPKMLDNAQNGEKVMTVDLEKDEIRIDVSKLYDNIDLAETLSCVTGKWIRRIYPRPDDPSQPGEVEFEDGTHVNLTNPPWELVKPLIWW